MFIEGLSTMLTTLILASVLGQSAPAQFPAPPLPGGVNVNVNAPPLPGKQPPLGIPPVPPKNPPYSAPPTFGTPQNPNYGTPQTPPNYGAPQCPPTAYGAPQCPQTAYGEAPAPHYGAQANAGGGATINTKKRVIFKHNTGLGQLGASGNVSINNRKKVVFKRNAF